MGFGWGVGGAGWGWVGRYVCYVTAAGGNKRRRAMGHQTRRHALHGNDMTGDAGRQREHVTNIRAQSLCLGDRRVLLHGDVAGLVWAGLGLGLSAAGAGATFLSFRGLGWGCPGLVLVALGVPATLEEQRHAIIAVVIVAVVLRRFPSHPPARAPDDAPLIL